MSAAFISTVLQHAPYRDSIAPGGFRIEGAWIPDTLDMTDGSAATFVNVEKSRFDDDLLLYRLRTPNAFALIGSTVKGELRLDEAKVGGTLALKQMTVGGTFSIESATAGRDITVSDTKFGGRAEFDSLTVAGNFFARRAAFAERAKMSQSAVSGHLDFGDAAFAKGIVLFGSSVGGYANFARTDVKQGLWLNYSRFGAALNLADAAFANVYLTAAQVAGKLFLGAEKRPAPRWTDSGFIDLQNATVGALQDRPDSWPASIEFSGFKYDRLGGFLGRENLAGRSPDWMRDWLARDASYTPQPYEQLSSALRQAGQHDKADDVMVAGADRRRATMAKNGEWLAWFTETLKRFLVGYGYRPYYAVFWIVGFVLLGTVVFRATPEAKSEIAQKAGMGSGFGYSLDMLLPIISLRDAHASIDFAGPARLARYYFYFHKMMGWVLASFLVAALAGFQGG